MERRGAGTRVKTRGRFESSIRNAGSEEETFAKRNSASTFRKRATTCEARIGIKRGRFHDIFTRLSTPESKQSELKNDQVNGE